MDAEKYMLGKIIKAFPARILEERAAPHECLECDEISNMLSGRSWNEIPRAFIAANCDVLPLLSQNAYVSYLAAWLAEGVREPDQGVASMLLVNLCQSPPVDQFSNEQADAIIEVSKYIVEYSIWGNDDPVAIEQITAIKRIWSATSR